MPITKRISRVIVNHPLVFIFVCSLSILFLAPAILRLQSDYSARIWFRTTDPLIKDLDLMEQQFGNDEKLVIALRSPNGIFRPKTIRILQELSDKTWLIPDILRVDSLTNYHRSYSEDDELITEPLFPHDKSDDEQFIAKQAKIALDDQFVRDQFVSKDGKIGLIYGQIRPGIKGGTNYRQIADAVKKLVAEYDHDPELFFHLTGSGAVNDAYREVSEGDLKKMIPVMLLILVAFFFYIFKTLDGIIMPLFLVAITILATFGFAVRIGVKFDNLTSALPGILIAICIADAIHVLVTYYRHLNLGEDKKTATMATLEKNFIPTFLTSFSTMIGFLSLTATELLPVKHLGYLAGFGTMYAWLLTIFFFCPLLQFIPYRPIGKSQDRLAPLDSEGGIISWIRSRKTIIFLGVIVTSLIGLYIGTLNEVNSDPLIHFSKKLKVRKDSDLLKERLGGVGGPEIMVDSGKKDGAKDPEFLRKIEILKHKVEEFPFVNKVVSITDIIKHVYQNLNNGNEESYRIPNTQNQVAETLLLYSMGLPEGMGLNNRISLDGRYLRLSLFWNLTDSKSSLNAIDKINQYAQELGLKITISGKLTLYHRMTDYIVETFFTSISVALILICLLMMIILRSWKLGLLSLLPNIIPLFYGVGFMTLTGKPIDIGTSLVVSVCLGIAVDDTVHFLTHYKFLLKDGLSQFDALKKVMSLTAPALTYTTFILTVGFGVFIFGDFVPNANFGILCAIILTLALFVDLIFLPAMLLKFKIRS